MTAEAHFCCRQNSHPFTERRVSLTEPAKIGRSVAKCRPSPTNAVFDCKVLSRNHALIWFDNGKFYLQDTKSSNGTFINNQRLSRTSEESGAVEVNSCDIVQFGVDVVDTTKKVTHGCIVSQLRLYLPNGEEFKQNERNLGGPIEKVPSNSLTPTVQFEDLYQLQQYIQEALHREQMLEQKLALLQRHVDDGQDASAKGWQALIDEDKLLSRLEFLENQLQLYKTQDEDSLHAKLQQLEDEKYNYENTSKETLRQAVQEKLEAVQKVASLEFLLGNLEDECTHYKMSQDETQRHLKELSAVHQTKLKDIDDLKENIKEMESRTNDLQTKFDALAKEKKDCDAEHLENTKQLQNEFLMLKVSYDEILNQSLKETSSPESSCEVGLQVDSEELNPNFYLNLTESKEESQSEKHCEECRRKSPTPVSPHQSKVFHNEENAKSIPPSENSPENSNPVRENGLPSSEDLTSLTSRESTTSTSSLSHEQLVAEESRLKLKLTDTERELNVIRTQIDASSDSISLPQADGDVLTTDPPAPKNKHMKKSSSLMLKMPSVKFGKRGSKKKAILSDSDCNESLVDSDEIHKELASCKEQLESRKLQIAKLEKDLSTLQEDAKNFSDLNQKLEQLQKEQQETALLKLNLQKTEENFTALNEKFSSLQDQLTHKEEVFTESERNVVLMREELSAKTLLLEQQESKETNMAEQCQQLTLRLTALEEDREVMSKQLEELEEKRREANECLDAEKSRTKELMQQLSHKDEEWTTKLKECEAIITEANARCQKLSSHQEQVVPSTSTAVDVIATNSLKYFSIKQTVFGLVVCLISFITYFIMGHSSS